MTCPSCGTENPPGGKFCSECGTSLALTCPSCGSAVAAEAKFCSECGTPLAGQPPVVGPSSTCWCSTNWATSRPPRSGPSCCSTSSPPRTSGRA
ncbi:MAG: zinc ribbon domain-containing protein [Actinomycetota bacterium]|nr:zinc ribbon domain-containing protein [Actinomycetota bacterium]